MVTRDFDLVKNALAKEEFSARPLARSVRAYRGELDVPGYHGLPGVAFSSLATWQVWALACAFLSMKNFQEESTI